MFDVAHQASLQQFTPSPTSGNLGGMLLLVVLLAPAEELLAAAAGAHMLNAHMDALVDDAAIHLQHGNPRPKLTTAARRLTAPDQLWQPSQVQQLPLIWKVGAAADNVNVLPQLQKRCPEISQLQLQK